MVLQIGVVLAITFQAPCDFAVSWEGPAVGESVVLARATGGREEVPGPFRSSSLGVPGTIATAWEFIVERATRPDPAEEAFGVLAPGQRFLALPWNVDASCEAMLWGSSEWVSAGSEVVFRVSSARVHEGTRVVDVRARHWPYPWAPVIPEAFQPGAPDDRGKWLPARDFYEILRAAPRSRNGSPTRDEVERLEMQFRTGPTYLLERFPGPQLLERLRGSGTGPAV